MPAKKKAPRAGTCRVCRCTDERACAGGCSWANGERTLCTTCRDTDRVGMAIVSRPSEYSLGEWLAALLPEGSWGQQNETIARDIERNAKNTLRGIAR